MSAAGSKSTSERVQALAATLQDTNHNLRAVERMIRDLSSERNRASPTLLKELRSRSSTGWLGERKMGPADTRGTMSDREEYRMGQEGGHPRLSMGQPYERMTGPGIDTEAISDREGKRTRQGEGRSRPTQRFYDDTSNDLHSFHQSLRDLSSEQRLLAEGMRRERESSRMMEKNKEEEVVERVDRRLRQIDAEIKAERDRWTTQQDSMIKVSLGLREALERQQERERERQTVERIQSRSQEVATEREALKAALAEQSEKLKEHLKTVLQQKQTEKEFQDLKEQVSQLSQQAARQRNDGIGRVGDREGEDLEIWRRQINVCNTQSEELKSQTAETEKIWKLKNDKLKQEVDWCKERLVEAEKERVESKRDLDNQRSRTQMLQQQLDRLLTEFNGVMSARIDLDEKLASRDFRLNEIQLAKNALEIETKECRARIAMLEKELQQSRESERVARETLEREAANSRSVEAASKSTSEVEMRMLSLERDEVSNKLSKLQIENQELKNNLIEMRNSYEKSRQDMDSLHRQNLMKNNDDIKHYQEIIKQQKVEHAQLLTELEEVKMAAKEERSINKLLKKQEVVIREDLSHSQDELSRTRKECEMIEQRYRQLRKDLATSALQAEDGWAKNKEAELELIDAHDALVRAARNHCNELHCIDSDVEGLIHGLAGDDLNILSKFDEGLGSGFGLGLVSRDGGGSNQASNIRDKLRRLRGILEVREASKKEHFCSGNHLEKGAYVFNHGDGLQKQVHHSSYDIDDISNKYLSEKDDFDDKTKNFREPIPSPTRSRSVSPSSRKNHVVAAHPSGSGRIEADSTEDINARYRKLKQTMAALREDVANAKLFGNLRLNDQSINQ